MSWSIYAKGPRKAVLDQILAMTVHQNQMSTAKVFIVSELLHDQSWGNTGVIVNASGHSGHDGSDHIPYGQQEYHAGMSIKIEHFKIDKWDATFTVPNTEAAYKPDLDLDFSGVDPAEQINKDWEKVAALDKAEVENQKLDTEEQEYEIKE